VAERYVDTSRLSGIEQASRTPVQDYPRGSAPNLPAVQRTPPQFDFSNYAIGQREDARRALAQQTLDDAAAEAQFGKEQGYTPYNLEVAYEQTRSAYFAMLNTYARPTAILGAERYPTLTEAALQANLDQSDVNKLLNLLEVDRAAERLIASMNLVYNEENDPNKRILGDRQIEQTLKSMNPIMRAATWDVVVEKIAASVEAPLGEPNQWLEVLRDGAGKALEAVMAPLIWANDQVQRAQRASSYGSYMEPEYDPIGINTIQNIFEYWDDVEKGKYNNEIIAAGIDQVGKLPMDLAMQIEQAKTAGDPDPLITVLAQNSTNPEAMAILEAAFYPGGESSSLAEASRILDNASLGNTGQVFLTTALRDEYLGSELRDTGAGALNVFDTLAADPTIFGAKIRTAYLSTRFAMEKIAPGATAAGIRGAFQMRPVRRYYDRLFNDIGRYEKLLKSDPTKAGLFREQMRRQYAETPDQVIDDFIERGIRTVDDLADDVVEQNAIFTIQKGGAAQELLGPDIDEVTPLFNLMVSDGQSLSRQLLLPRMTLTRALKTNFSRTVSIAMPKARGAKAVKDAYGNTDDAAEFTARISDPAVAAQAGAIERSGITSRGWFGKKVDRFTRYFSSVGLGAVSITDGSDAKLIYRYARSFLSRTHATYIADRWRGANASQRYDILVGLNRTAAAAKGIDITNPEMLARVDEMVTATSTGSRFAAKSKPISAIGGGPVAEFEATAERLYHGTNRAFERFDETVAQPRGSRSLPRTGGGRNIYFSDRQDVAETFSKEAGSSAKMPSPADGESVWVDYVRVYGNGDERAAVMYALDNNGAPRVALLEEVTADGQLVSRFTENVDEILDYIYLNGDTPLMYPRGELPRVIEADVYGKTLDLYIPNSAFDSDAAFSKWISENVPDDLQQALKDEGTFGWIFNRMAHGSQYQHERSSAIVNWARDNGYGKIVVNDAPLSGGRSIIVVPEMVKYGTNDPVSALRSTLDEQQRAAADLTDPSDFNGVSKALFDWQTAKYVALPNFREMEKLARWYRMLDSAGVGWISSVPQRVTDAWSLGTLYGLRFSMRSAAEDLWFYAVITGGNLGDLYKARRASTVLREVRGRTRQGAWASLVGKDAPKSTLGMVNKRLRRIGDSIDNSNSEMARIFGNFIQGNLDQGEVAMAFEAANKGDFAPMRRLASLALVNAKMTGLKGKDRDYILDLVSGPFGMKYIDELAETGRSINSGGLPDLNLDVPGTDSMGVTVGAVPRTSNGLRPTGEWSPELPVENSNVGAMMAWERFLNGVITNDGPVGQIIVANLDDVQRAARLAADEIRIDPTKFGYADRFAALAEVTPEEFALRKVQAVRAAFSDANGNLNTKLWRRVVDEDGSVRAFDVVEGQRVYRINQSTLRNIPASERPQYVLGQEYGAVPTASGIGAFADNTWAWMGEQYARIAREPVFIANYLGVRKQLASYQAQLAEKVGEKAASRIVSRMAEDRAYAFTLSFVDNPANRSLLAYKVRNVSRYYRATEDFYRRMLRAGKQYPVGLWKTALTYDVLDDTGFIYEDDEGNKYFMYPGSKELMSAMSWFAGARGDSVVQMDYPFFLGGKVNMLAPSTDPNQAIPTVAGAPIIGFGWRMMQRAFPSLDRLNKLVLGEYGANPDTSLGGALAESFLPAGATRVLRALNTDERESMFAAAQKDAIAIAVANGAIPANAGPEAMNSPEFENAMAGINAIAFSAVVTRLALSWVVPASPQRYVDNVSDYARMNGSVSLRGAFLDLVQKHAEADEENPVGGAMVEWYRLNPNLFPYTVSKTEADTSGNISFSPLKSGEEVLAWYKDNRESLIKQYPRTAYFLAPQAEGFDWDTWGLIMGQGLRVSKDDMTFLRDVYASYGEFQHYATIADYQRDLDLLDPRDPEQYSEIRKLEAQRSDDLALVRDRNHWWKKKYEETRNFQGKTGTAETALLATKKMVDELYDSTPDEEWQGSPAQAIRNSILTYIDYQTEINMITGQTAEDNLKKRTLRFELQKDLEFLAEADPNAKLFIMTVLYSDPGLSILDTSTIGD